MYLCLTNILLRDKEFFLARVVKTKYRLELGWVDSFNTDDNTGVWNDWLQGDGVFSNIRYHF